MSALSNVVTILRFLRGHSADVAVGEIAAALAMPKSTASRLLKDMAAQGLLERDPQSGRYRVGLLLVELGRCYRAEHPFVEAADQELAELTQRTDYATGISVLDGQSVVVLRARAGTHPLRVVTPAGTRVPAWATSTGRNLLALLPDAEIARRFTPFPPSASPNAPSDLRALMQRIRQARAAGFDESCDEALPGIAAVSVAVADPHSGEAIALYAAFSLLHVKKQIRRDIAADLLDIKSRLIGRFGGADNGGTRRAHG